MSDSSVPRQPRPVEIADHLWQAFERMAHDMGSDRNGLINQALFMFARLNGYLEPGHTVATARFPEPTPRLGTDADEVSAPRLAAVPPISRFGTHPPPPPPDSIVPPFDSPSRPALDAAAAAAPVPPATEAPPASPAPETTASGAGARPALRIRIGDGPEVEVVGDRFVIGRGKHCDLVVANGKVSREHAAIVWDAEGWVIEDLGSSNGTWFNKQRIQRRSIASGDEYYICSERLTCALQ